MKLSFQNVQEKFDLLAPSVQNFLKKNSGNFSLDEISVAEIDPHFMGGKDLCEQYNIPEEMGVNCVVVEGVRGEEKNYAACLLPVTCKKADFNGVIRKFLNVRRVSLASLDFVLQETGMEYGSVTPVGLPEDWKILVDASILQKERIICGSGLQKSKLSFSGKLFLEFPNVFVLDNMWKEKISQ